MNNVCAEVVAHLKTGLAAAGHDYPVTEHNRKQGVTPPGVLVVGLNTGRSFEHLGGPVGIDFLDFDVYCYATTDAGAFTLAEAVRVILQGYRGTMGGTFVNQITSQTTFEKGTDPPAKGSNRLTYWVVREYTAAHN